MAYKTVICYAREDKKFREELDSHLSNLKRQLVLHEGLELASRLSAFPISCHLIF
jgi:hypothetical protein